MNRHRGWLPGLLLLAGSVLAQPSAEIAGGAARAGGGRILSVGSRFLDTTYKRLGRGDQVDIQVDTAYLVSPLLWQRLGYRSRYQDSLSTLDLRVQGALEAVLRKHDSLALGYRGLDSAQERSFEALLARTHSLDSLLRRSTQTTDNALAQARTARLQGFVTSGLLGAVGGYVVIHHWGAALGGCAGGALLNWLLVYRF